MNVLLDYWIEHNKEHEQEFRDWADKVGSSSAEVVERLHKASAKMAAATKELVKAKEILAKSKGRR